MVAKTKSFVPHTKIVVNMYPLINYLTCDDEAIATQVCENLNKMFGFPISVINNQLFTDEKSKLVKTEKETICDINTVIFGYFDKSDTFLHD